MEPYNNWHTQLKVDEINRQSERDNALKETRDLLLKMQSDSEKESRLSTRRFRVNLFITLIGAIAAVISAIVCIIPFVS